MATTTEPAVSPADRRGKPTPAQRLLDTATTLFARYGIRAVGIDRVLAEAGVARASMYSAYGSKDALVVAYLENLDRCDRARWHEAIAEVVDPQDRILAFFDLALASAPDRGFRGCRYANAATEFPDEPLAPVVAHRRWMFDTLTELLRIRGAADPPGLARRIQLIYDGALAGSKLEHAIEPLQIGRAVAVELLRGG
ncbi:TetR/AcrR family transcriptional regulator [Nocardia speluncae]|uniref:TetR/AcrR family transcriptional regulator n=1 Tax=Nocardia speluncae TaxID=419477 RepID=A0A846XE44_9NOCA|nr:TetR/AcrR family transcriptional regulator [Nocardia speluncae]NKY33449.1 TetR/AcrR family transcriptional regulator [Nocardia speluncae]